MVATATVSLSGPRKAAILMVLVGDELASKMLRHLPESQVVAIAREVASLGEVPPEVAGHVLEEYFLEAIRPEIDCGGEEVARRLLARAEIPEKVRRQVLAAGTDSGSDEALEPLRGIATIALSRALQEEHPQTAALVLLHLPPRKAAAVLKDLPEEERAEAVLRMSSLRQVNGELVGEVASSLCERLGDVDAEEEAPGEEEGMQRTAEVLQSLSRSDARELLDQLEQQDPERAAQLRDQVYTFATLQLADDRGIQELLRLVESKQLALALHGEDRALSDKILGNLSERAAGMLREEMEYLGAVRPEDREAAQREILAQALQLEQDEKLRFEDPQEAGGES